MQADLIGSRVFVLTQTSAVEYRNGTYHIAEGVIVHASHLGPFIMFAVKDPVSEQSLGQFFAAGLFFTRAEAERRLARTGVTST